MAIKIHKMPMPDHKAWKPKFCAKTDPRNGPRACAEAQDTVNKAAYCPLLLLDVLEIQ